MMSEETCPKCGMPLDQCRCGEVITVKHEGLYPSEKGESGETVSREEFERVKAEKEELASVIEIEAMKSFDKEVFQWLKEQGVPEDRAKEIKEDIMESDDPVAKFEGTKTALPILVEAYKIGGIKIKRSGEETRKPTPSKIPAYTPSKGSESYKKVVDELYGILLDPKTSEMEKQEANRRLDELFGEMIRGMRKGTTKISITQCPSCGELLPADKQYCEACGWNRYVKRR